MRRILGIGSLVAIVVACGWWLWRWHVGTAALADPWTAVPRSATAVLELPEPAKAWSRITGTSQFWNDLDNEPLFAAIDTIMGRVGDRLGKGGMLLIWDEGAGDPVLVHAMLPSDAALEILREAFGQAVPADLWTGRTVGIPADTAWPALQLAWRNGLLAVGTDAARVTQCLAGERSASPPAMARARNSFSVGADARLLIKAASAPSLLDLREHNTLFPDTDPADGWMAFDVRLRPEAVLLSGVLFPGGAQAKLAALHREQPAGLQVMQVLPATATHLRVEQVTEPRERITALGGEAPDESLFAAYGEWVHGAMAMARDADMAWGALETEDPNAARRAMEARCPDGGCPTTAYRNVEMVRMADQGALAMYGDFFAGIHQPLWAVLGNAVVVAETPAAMRAAIDAWTDRNSLALSPATGEFFNRYGTRAVYTWWADVPASYKPAAGVVGKLQQAVAKVLVQLSPREDGTFLATACLQHATMGHSDDGTLWTTALPASTAQRPWLVKDYLSRTLQVLAQDRENRVSLISCTGKLLWQRQLDGPILGEVQQIDRYRNNKLQLLFNTPGKVYLIDRLGRDVEGFPVALKAQASAPLSVFDYEHNKDYRMVVPLVNGQLANLGPDGRAVEGWGSKPLNSPASAPVEHVRIKGKDYLVVVQRNGAVQVLDRRGAPRYDAALRMTGFDGLLASREAASIEAYQLIWADSSGAVLSGTLAGKVDTLSQAASGRAILFDAGPGKQDAVLRTTENLLTAETRDQVLFRLNFPDSRRAEAFAVSLPGRPNGIGLALPGQEQVRLYHASGELWHGFPMKGAVPFALADINLDGVLELVTADGEGMIVVYALPVDQP